MLKGTRLLAILLALGFSSTLLIGCGTYEQYHAYVVEVDPIIPSLVVEATRGIRGEIVIRNDTGMDVFVFDEHGQERIWITTTMWLFKDEEGNWGQPRRGNYFVYGSSPVRYDGSDGGLPKGSYPGQVMREWTIEGRAGDTPFKIYGQTVYEPPP